MVSDLLLDFMVDNSLFLLWPSYYKVPFTSGSRPWPVPIEVEFLPKLIIDLDMVLYMGTWYLSDSLDGLLVIDKVDFWEICVLPYSEIRVSLLSSISGKKIMEFGSLWERSVHIYVSYQPGGQETSWSCLALLRAKVGSGREASFLDPNIMEFGILWDNKAYDTERCNKLPIGYC